MELHHIDNSGYNNDLNNTVFITKSNHGKLNHYATKSNKFIKKNLNNAKQEITALYKSQKLDTETIIDVLDKYISTVE